MYDAHDSHFESQEPCSRCLKRGIACERREFRRTRWKGNPDAIDTASTLERDSRSQQNQEGQNTTLERTERVTEDTRRQDSPMRPPSKNADTGLMTPSPTSGTSEATFEVIQPDMINLALSLMPHQIYDNQEADYSHITGFAVPIGIHHDDTLPSTTSNSSSETMHFDPDPNEDHSIESLTDMDLTSAMSGTMQPHLDWSLDQHQLPSSINTFTRANDTESLQARRGWPMFQSSLGGLSSATPRTQENITKLQTLDDPSAWSTCTNLSLAADLQAPRLVNSFVRDRMLATTQYIWQISKTRIFPSENCGRYSKEMRWLDTITLLPQGEALSFLVTKYIRQENTQLHLFAEAKPFPSEHNLPRSENRIVAGTLILLKLAHTMRCVNCPRIRDICTGFTEICVSLVDETLLQDYTSQKATTEWIEVSVSLLQLLAWGGNSWHMTVSKAFVALLRFG